MNLLTISLDFFENFLCPQKIHKNSCLEFQFNFTKIFLNFSYRKIARKLPLKIKNL